MARPRYPAYLPPPRQQSPYGYGQPPSAQSNAFAVTSLVLGIISVIVPWAGVLAGPLAIIFGALRLRRWSAGRGMAIAGFVLGIFGTIGSIILIIAAGLY